MAARSAVLWALVLVVSVTACGRGLSPVSTDQDDGGPSIEEIIELEATESQAPYLADGDVTPAEREAAFLAWVTCMESQGVVVTDYSLDPHGGETINVDSAFPEDLQDRIVTQCRQEHYLVVAAVYTRQHGLTQAEEAEQAERIAQCMRDRGVDVPEGLTFLQLQDIDPFQAGLCYETVRR